MAKMTENRASMSASLKEAIAAFQQVRRPTDRSALCHAPSVSLNFDQSGNASACCYNRRYFLGRYPKNSLEEIWNGKRIQELRKTFKKFQFAEGCEQCEQHLVARNFSGMRIHGYDGINHRPDLKPSDTPMPRIMEFELSNLCNLECIMCSGFFSSLIRKNRELLEPMPQVYDDAFVEQLKPFLPYLAEAKFLGGEPLVNPIYFKIWQAILDINPKIHVVITTNATVLTSKTRRLIEAIRPHIVVSCDSLDPKIYESIRINAKYETMRENLETLIALTTPTHKGLSISVCPMKVNWHTIPDLLEFCTQKNIGLFFNTVTYPLKLSMKTMEKEDLNRAIKFLDARCDEKYALLPGKIARYNYANYQNMLNQLRFWSQENA
jgi:MoaA/NifB/PqqE/SkfB family radical SAM enzyme